MTNPTVSVVMATYNGAARLPETLHSLLAQTFADFELVIVDDCSTDGTRHLLHSFADERIKILSTPANSGPVRARNLAVTATTGRYIAALDQDDISLPHRLARQVATLDAQPKMVALGTASRRLVNGRLMEDRLGTDTTPGFIRWMLHVMNPLVWSSVMLRRSAVEKLDVFSRQERLFAEDFDLYHRLAAYGEIARLDEVLTTYRWHQAGASSTSASQMIASAGAVLEDAYRPWFGEGAARAARLINHHIAARQPAPDRATFRELRQILSRLFTAFCKTFHPDQTTRDLISAQTTRLLRDAFGDSLKGKFRVVKLPQRQAACI
jgi:glycosyltransferase involved in cell wall biosynthesis